MLLFSFSSNRRFDLNAPEGLDSLRENPPSLLPLQTHDKQQISSLAASFLAAL